MIVQLINPAGYGGLESVVRHLSVGAKSHGADLCVLAVLDRESDEPPLLAELRAAGVQVHCLAVGPRRYVAEASAIRAMLHRLDAGLVHSHGYRMDVMARLAIARSRMRWMTTLHGFTGGDWKNRMFEAAQIRCVRSADRVVAVSSPIAARMRSSAVRPERIEIVKNAVPLRKPYDRNHAQSLLGLDPNSRWAGWVGRLSVEKDPVLFVSALREVLRAGDLLNVRGVIVGDGPLRSAVELAGADLIASGQLKMAGQVADAGQTLSALDVLVNTSVTEGTPMVVLEGMQVGIPVVAPPVGGLPELLRDNAGRLTTDRSAVSVADAIRSILQDRVFEALLRAQATERIRREYNASLWIARYRDIWTALLQSANRT